MSTISPTDKSPQTEASPKKPPGHKSPTKSALEGQQLPMENSLESLRRTKAHMAKTFDSIDRLYRKAAVANIFQYVFLV